MNIIFDTHLTSSFVCVWGTAQTTEKNMEFSCFRKCRWRSVHVECWWNNLLHEYWFGRIRLYLDVCRLQGINHAMGARFPPILRSKAYGVQWGANMCLWHKGLIMFVRNCKYLDIWILREFQGWMGTHLSSQHRYFNFLSVFCTTN